MILFIFFFLTNLFSEESSSVNITMDKNSNSIKTYLSYNLRFSDFNDILRFYNIPLDFYRRLFTIDLRSSFRLKYHGYSTYPFRYFISKKKKVEFNSKGESAKQVEEKNYFKLSLNPFYEDLKENIDWYILDITMRHFSNDWGNLDYKSKNQFLNDLSSLNIPLLSSIEKNKNDKILGKERYK